jgi:HlyD family secretion protein
MSEKRPTAAAKEPAKANLPAVRSGPPPAKVKFSSSIRRYVLVGVAACLLLFVGFGGWAVTATLASAVISGGTIVVASNVKQIQHPDGGIVGEIRVSDGDAVKAGDLLIRLDETLVAANRALLDQQIVALEARLARLHAQRDSEAAVALPAGLAGREAEPIVAQAMASERKVFDAAKETIKGQVDRLEERIGQLRQQIEGLEAQQRANEQELGLIDEELAVLGDLYTRGATTRDRIVALKRNRSRLEGERGDLIAQIAVAKGRINETELEVLQLTTDQREKTFKEITEVEPQLANLKERRAAADFQLTHMDIRAPVSGTVFELKVHTVGGVVQPGQTVMQIVPEADQLVIETKVMPSDVDQVAIGQKAVVILSAFDHRTTPQLDGHVIFVAAEATRDERTGLSYYVSRVKLDDGQLDRLDDGLVLMPGMPAEVYISIGGMTVAEYLMKPLEKQLRHAWREG